MSIKKESSPESIVREIKRQTRRKFAAEEIWLVRGWLAPFRWFQLNLTSNDAVIYHSPRWGEAKSVP